MDIGFLCMLYENETSPKVDVSFSNFALTSLFFYKFTHDCHLSVFISMVIIYYFDLFFLFFMACLILCCFDIYFNPK